MPDKIDKKDILSRQRPLKLNVPKHVAVIGCSGVGWYVAKLLALAGVQQFDLYDGDYFDIINLNRVDLEPSKAKAFKTKALLEELKRIRDVEVVWHRELEDPKELGEINPDFVFECTDSSICQQMVDEYCKKNRIPICQIHYNGKNSISIEFGMSIDKEWGELVSHYTIVPSCGASAVAAASLGVYYVLTGQTKLARSINLDKIGRIMEE